jgi:hypothetical protein
MVHASFLTFAVVPCTIPNCVALALANRLFAARRPNSWHRMFAELLGFHLVTLAKISRILRHSLSFSASACAVSRAADSTRRSTCTWGIVQCEQQAATHTSLSSCCVLLVAVSGVPCRTIWAWAVLGRGAVNLASSGAGAGELYDPHSGL